jgi:hypothetical protein
MPDYRCVLYEDLYAWLEARGVDHESVGPEMAIYHASEFVENLKPIEDFFPFPLDSHTVSGSIHFS